MGSCGSWDASVSLNRKIEIKKKEVNSAEIIAAFIKKNPKILMSRKEKPDMNSKDLVVSLTIYDEDEEENVFDGDDYKLPSPMTFSEFVKSEIWKTDKKITENIDSGTSDIFHDCDEYNFTWTFKVQNDISKLEKTLTNLDLDLIQKNIHEWDVNKPNVIFKSEHLASCSDYIYCHNDNSCTEQFKITQKWIDSLRPGDIIELYGNGDGEHC